PPHARHARPRRTGRRPRAPGELDRHRPGRGPAQGPGAGGASVRPGRGGLRVALPTLPVIELGAPVLGEAEKQALLAVIDDRWLTMGDRVRAFERAFADLHGVDAAVAVGSATAALQLILAAFDVGAGDEVLVPSMSFVATASVVVHVGATPVFVDIE